MFQIFAMKAVSYRIEEALGYVIGRTFFRLKNKLRQEFKSHGHDVTPEQWAVICKLREEDDLNQNALASRTIKDKTTITRILDSLERKDLIARRRDGRDRRSHRVQLTAKGRELGDRLLPIVEGFCARVYGRLSQTDRADLVRILDAINDRLDESERPAEPGQPFDPDPATV